MTFEENASVERITGDRPAVAALPPWEKPDFRRLEITSAETNFNSGSLNDGISVTAS